MIPAPFLRDERNNILTIRSDADIILLKTLIVKVLENQMKYFRHIGRFHNELG